MERDVELSVVVTIVDGGRALERCLDALLAQVDPPTLEVLVPYDDSVPEIERLAARFPRFHFVALGRLPTRRPEQTSAGQHELYDRRRAAGLGQAQGDLVAMLEDRGVPRPDWARRFVEAHLQPYQVIGGAVENGRDRLLSWAVYFCDFGRFQLPFENGAAGYVSDVNVCYKRAALDSTRELWRDRFHETTVHWALQRRGEALCLTPGVVVDEIREPPGFLPLLAERLSWGRLFAFTRGRERTLGQRLIYAAASPLLPVVLVARQTSLRARKRVALTRFLQAFPLIVTLEVAWSVGEMIGYLTCRP